MPRKVNHGLDYDEDYDAYDDYDDYDYDYGADGNDYENDNGMQGDGNSSQQGTKVSRPRIWQCSICTYDNDESSLSCEICGIIRDCSANFDNNDKDKAIDMSKSSEASIMGKSNLTQVPSAPLQTEITSVGFPSKKASKSFGKVHEVQSVSARAASSFNEEGIAVSSEITDNSSFSLSKASRDVEDATKSLASNLDHLKLNNNTMNSKKAPSRTPYKSEKWMFQDQEQGILSQLNLAIVGHVDSGKSTLSGRLLYLLGRISKREMHKYEKGAKEMGKGSFAYAWAMDESYEERERGITMTVAVAYFDSKKYRIVLLDSPGHKDFVPNMISGATQADAAVLVVDASVGSFEAGMDGNGVGQTREHAQLIRSFGVEQIIVAVNKMDMVGYSKERFNFIKLQLSSFLRSRGFKDSSVTWIPISAMENQNLVEAASDVRFSGWYQGLCLLDAIDSLQPPLRDFSKPLILPICDVIKSQSMGQVAACGKLETGAIRHGSKVLVMPSGDLATVRSIERDSSTCSVARAGDNVAVSLQGIDSGLVMPGGVLCHPDFPVRVATRLELKILVLDNAAPILIGSQVEFHIHHAKEAARVVKILSLLDQKTGQVSRMAPRILKAKQSAVIEVALDGAVCVEEYSKCRALGRAFLRSSGSTIAVGVVTRVPEPDL
ncbi:HBS1-like protein isoform X1 [Phoenix dactylifera]|uniref:HBS1-like protein isoform X1 n=1 Tax=Phoenix dactylifera TaxID=42345 RepID=A0A8B7CUW4_PHODC|nr:HBS1-like protein isoform X1 [Phoenix dactylifera]XP_008806644.1 HBS1-like protein isoform X1 [Phoenix dactylifera]